MRFCILIGLLVSGVHGLAGDCSEIESSGWVLSPGVTYFCQRTLVIPEGITLQSPDSARPNHIVADVDFNPDSPLVQLSRNSSIKDMVINGAFRTRTLINIPPVTNDYVVNRKGIDNDLYKMEITGNKIINAYNGSRNFPTAAMIENPAAVVDVMGIRAKGSRDGRTTVRRVYIANNELYGIGFKSTNPNRGKVNPDDWRGRGIGIFLNGVIEAQVRDNNIYDTLTAGINFGGSRDILIKGNEISNTGRNRDYQDFPDLVGDAITAYKNRSTVYSGIYSTDNPENFRIFDNLISGSRNNGIHVSGVQISIIGNEILAQRHRGIYYGHTASSSPIGVQDPMERATIRNNILQHGYSENQNYTAPYFVRTPASGKHQVTVKWNEILD